MILVVDDLPANVRLSSVEFNPAGMSGAGDWDKLVLSGVLRAEAGQDRMRGVADLVERLRRDSLLRSATAAACSCMRAASS